MVRKNAHFINQKLKTSEGRLFRNYKNGNTSINAFLDDYAFTIEAFICLYQATFEEKWLLNARQMTEYVIDHFYDNKLGMFYFTSDIDPSLVVRKIETTDNVIPSGNSQMAKNLYMLSQYFIVEEYLEKSKRMISTMKRNALKGSIYYANWNAFITWLVNEPYEVAILGNNFDTIRKEFDRCYLPNVFFSGGNTEGTLQLLENKLVEGQTTIYVCQNKICKLPVTDVSDALKRIKN